MMKLIVTVVASILLCLMDDVKAGEISTITIASHPGIVYTADDCATSEMYLVTTANDTALVNTIAGTSNQDVYKFTVKNVISTGVCIFTVPTLYPTGNTDRITVPQGGDVNFLHAVLVDASEHLVNLTQLVFENLDNITDCTQEVGTTWNGTISYADKVRFYTESTDATAIDMSQYNCSTAFTFGKANETSPDVTGTTTTITITTTVTTGTNTTTSSTTHPDEEHIQAYLWWPPSFNDTLVDFVTMKVYPTTLQDLTQCHLDFNMTRETVGARDYSGIVKHSVTGEDGTLVFNHSDNTSLASSLCYNLTESVKVGSGVAVYYTFEVHYLNGSVIDENVTSLDCGFADGDITTSGEGLHDNELRKFTITSNLSVTNDQFGTCETDDGIVIVKFTVQEDTSSVSSSSSSSLESLLNSNQEISLLEFLSGKGIASTVNAISTLIWNVSHAGDDDCTLSEDGINVTKTGNTYKGTYNVHESCLTTVNGRPALYYQLIVNGVAENITGQDCALECVHDANATCRARFMDNNTGILDDYPGNCSLGDQSNLLDEDDVTPTTTASPSDSTTDDLLGLWIALGVIGALVAVGVGMAFYASKNPGMTFYFTRNHMNSYADGEEEDNLLPASDYMK